MWSTRPAGHVDNSDSWSCGQLGKLVMWSTRLAGHVNNSTLYPCIFTSNSPIGGMVMCFLYSVTRDVETYRGYSVVLKQLFSFENIIREPPHEKTNSQHMRK